MNLYIFRHGQTYFSKNNILYGNKIETAEILAEGIPIVKKLAEYLKGIKTDANFTSPYKRCVQTSGLVLEITGKKFTVDENLRDWDPGKETVEDMIKRIKVFSKKLDASRYSSVSICTHGFPINAIIAYFTKGKIERADLENYPNPGVLVTIENGKVSYKDFNLNASD